MVTTNARGRTRSVDNKTFFTPEMSRVDLAVPFTEKDEAHSLGAHWDSEKKVWFIPADFKDSRDVFDRWLPAIKHSAKPLADAQGRRFFDDVKDKTIASLRDGIRGYKDRIREMGVLLEKERSDVAFWKAKHAALKQSLDSRNLLIDIGLGIGEHEAYEKAGCCVLCREFLHACTCDEPPAKKAKR